ncbi:uncharacterized protein LOC128394480 [Panonychus citri]|uniref:uncharacterized protein LOC128394480 n=1 Tax=Panonychus citri TaxID=50023 RepID=UPI002307B2F1|nr:uncharacterized protein LOC128394480 [Panonychus citri]XP_053210786.1 uncharacterized protein LOC128394480 [Panonychus citri]XP_053210787.1 uncharacterized protein LOC128394480 [Panonychus citri]
MSLITNGSTVDCPSIPDDASFKHFLHSLKCSLTATDSFHRFIQFSSSSHGSVIGENLSTIKSILIQIILKLLSSFKFKFTSLIDCHGLGPRPGFTEMLHQMDKYCINDTHHWTLIVEETRKSLDKFSSVNKAKYEDLVQFVHLSVDHLVGHNIRLDLESFAVIFNVIASSKPSTNLTTMGHNLPSTMLDFTPLSILPVRIFNNQVRVIKEVNCTTPPGSPATLHSKSCLSTHRRRLNWDALEDEPDDSCSTQNSQSISSSETDSSMTDYKLIPIKLWQIKIYQRPVDYSFKLNESKSPLVIPLECTTTTACDPRIENRIVVVMKKSSNTVRKVNTNGSITVNLTSTNIVTTATITSPDPEDNPKPAKRKRIIWDLD